MSIVTCEVCDEPIDTDEDVDAFQAYFGIDGSWICEKCREEQIDNYTESLPFGD